MLELTIYGTLGEHANSYIIDVVLNILNVSDYGTLCYLNLDFIIGIDIGSNLSYLECH